MAFYGKVISREVPVMDEQKKQKVLLALTAVLVLGAGASYWLLARDSGADVKRVARSGPTERRQKATPVTPERKHKVRPAKRTVVRATQRNVRTSQDNRRATDRRDKHRRDPRTKRNKTGPAG